MDLIRLIVAAQERKADREILRVLRRDTHHDSFKVEIARRLLGQ